MVDYKNYSVANVSNFTAGYDYGATILQQGSGIPSYDIFGVLVLFGIFMVFTGISIKYNHERAVLYGSFMTSIAAAIMVSGGMLNPIWAVVPFSIFLIALFVWGWKT